MWEPTKMLGLTWRSYHIYFTLGQLDAQTGDWSATTREATDGFYASPSSPSTSISAVPDSFGNISTCEQQPALETASMVVADFLKFKPEKNELANPIPIDSRSVDGTELVKGRKLAPFQDTRCRSEGAGRLSKPNDVDMSMSQGWEGYPATNAPLFLSGPKRPIGGPPSTTQVQVYNRENVSAGPGIRLELLKSTEEIQREEVVLCRADVVVIG
ncbi:hypothetical protein Ancab_018850 [Ancistrocladus abbreviatus]